MAGLARAAEDPEIGFVELLARLVDRMQRNERVLELGRRFANDRLAVAVDAIDVVAADILRRIARASGRRRAPVDAVLDFAGPAIRLLVKAFCAQIGAAPVRLEITAVIGC